MSQIKKSSIFLPRKKAQFQWYINFIIKPKWSLKNKSTQTSSNPIYKPKSTLNKYIRTLQLPLRLVKWKQRSIKKSEIENWIKLRLKRGNYIKYILPFKTSFKVTSQRSRIMPKTGPTSWLNCINRLLNTKQIPTNSGKSFVSPRGFLL